MWNAISSYLALTHHVNIPGVGSLRLETTPAFIRDNTIMAPAQALVFSSGTALTDKHFYNYLARETGLGEVDAIRRFQDFAYELRKTLQAHGEVLFTGLGRLTRNNQGEFIFHPTFNAADYFPDIALKPLEPGRGRDQEPVAGMDAAGEEGVQVNEVRPDRWWIWAVIMAMSALAAIGYYYFQEQR